MNSYSTQKEESNFYSSTNKTNEEHTKQSATSVLSDERPEGIFQKKLSNIITTGKQTQLNKIKIANLTSPKNQTSNPAQLFAPPHRIRTRVWLHSLSESLAQHNLTLSADQRFVYIAGEGDINARHIHIDFTDDGADEGDVVQHMVLSLILPKGNLNTPNARPHLENEDTDNWIGSVNAFPQATTNVVTAFRAWFLANRI